MEFISKKIRIITLLPLLNEEGQQSNDSNFFMKALILSDMNFTNLKQYSLSKWFHLYQMALNSFRQEFH